MTLCAAAGISTTAGRAEERALLVITRPPRGVNGAWCCHNALFWPHCVFAIARQRAGIVRAYARCRCHLHLSAYRRGAGNLENKRRRHRERQATPNVSRIVE